MTSGQTVELIEGAIYRQMSTGKYFQAVRSAALEGGLVLVEISQPQPGTLYIKM